MAGLEENGGDAADKSNRRERLPPASTKHCDKHFSDKHGKNMPELPAYVGCPSVYDLAIAVSRRRLDWGPMSDRSRG